MQVEIVSDPILFLALLLATAKILGYIARHLGQPSMLGEILAGVLLGPSLLNLVQPSGMLEVLAELGIFFLMFLIGMRIRLMDLISTTKTAGLVAISGVILPFFLGYGFGVFYGFGPLTAFLLGVALSVTSVAISADVVAEFKLLKSFAGKTIIEAGLIDNIFSLLMLSAVIGVFHAAQEPGLSAVMGFLTLFFRIIAFFLVAFVLGYFVMPFLLRHKSVIQDRRNIFSFIIIFIIILAGTARLVGLHGIIGAFVAGISIRHALERKEESSVLIDEVSVVSRGLLTPLFFIWLGISINFIALAEVPFVVVAVILIAMIGKIAGCGLVVFFMKKGWKNAMTVGVGMNERGAVELIVAEIGRRIGVFDQTLFSVIVIMAFVTTMVTPTFLRMILHRHPDPKSETWG